MRYNVYKKTCKSFVGEKLDTVVEPNNLMDHYVAAIFQER